MSVGQQRHDLSIGRAANSLSRRFGLSPALAARVCELSAPVERYPPGSVICAAGASPCPKWILSGWTCEMRTLLDGRRQIFAFGLAGDIVRATPQAQSCALVALTTVDCFDLGQAMSRGAEAERGEIAAAVQAALDHGQEQRYEQIARLRRRSAVERIADLLTELHDRLDEVGLVQNRGFPLPLTQEHLADALGLSVVHISRSLKTLRERGMAALRFGRVTQFDRTRLEEICRD